MAESPLFIFLKGEFTMKNNDKKNAAEAKKMPKSKSKAENRAKNTTNYGPDSHRKFCARCYAQNGKRCPATNSARTSKTCDL